MGWHRVLQQSLIEHARYIFSDHIKFYIDGCSFFESPEICDLLCERNKRHVYDRSLPLEDDFYDRETHTIERDTSLVDTIVRIFTRKRNSQSERSIGIHFPLSHISERINMSGHHMPIDSITQLQTPLHIICITDLFRTKIRHSKGFFHGKKRVGITIRIKYSHAYAIMGDAFSSCEHGTKYIFQRENPFMDRKNLGLRCDNTREHDRKTTPIV